MTSALLTAPISGAKLVRKGKVRELYQLGEHVLIVATDRISAFDVIMANGIPDKGRVLNQLSAFWFDQLAEIGPNHMVSVDAKAMGLEAPELQGRCMLCTPATPLPIECVARGYLEGSFYKSYAEGEREICGVELPEGLVRGSRLPEPIFTPATKAEEGHDINISFADAVNLVGIEAAGLCRDWTLRAYRQAAEFALTKGLILADTKFEFGLNDDGLLWIDEALTPDSSRYWEASQWSPGHAQPSYDKQFVRDFLEGIAWDKKPPGPELPSEVVSQTRAKYLEAFERLTGHVLAV